MTIHELSETDYCDVVMIGEIDRMQLDYNTKEQAKTKNLDIFIWVQSMH